MPASKPDGVTKPYCYFIAGLLHAALMLLAFPPVGIWAAAVFAPVPLIWAGHAWGRRTTAPGSSPKPRWRRFRWLWARTSGPFWVTVGCFPLHAYAHQWVFNVSEFGYPPMFTLMAAFSGLFVWMVARMRRTLPRVGLVVVAPVLWTALEIFRGEVAVTGYPWILIAHPLIDAPHFPGVASLLGTYFAGFLIVTLSAAIYEGLWLRRWMWATPAAVSVGAIVAAWGGPPSLASATPLRVGVVQTNVPQSNKSGWDFGRRMADFQRFLELSRAAAAQNPDFIVWPETMFPGVTLSPDGVAEERRFGLTFEDPADSSKRVNSTVFMIGLMALSDEIKIPMLVGALGFDGLKLADDNGYVDFKFKARYNSIFQVSRSRVDPTPYSKLELTPFGEIMPYINHWPWLQNVLLGIGANGMQFDLSPGPGPRVFEINGTSIVTPICFEATKPGLCRRLVRAAVGRPVIMVNATNDGWFGAFRAGRLQHLQIARWRCVELGVPMVRAANTGISASIDAGGKILESGVQGAAGAWNQDGFLLASVTPSISNTLYARMGDVFGWIVWAVGLAMILATFVPRRANPLPGA